MDDAPSMDMGVAMIHYAVLTQVAAWLAENGLYDLTQVDDGYIQRMMVRYDCFSVDDVVKEKTSMAKKLGLPNDNDSTLDE